MDEGNRCDLEIHRANADALCTQALVFAGRLLIKGRKKEMIVTPQGLNVFPEDVERALLAQPGVRDAGVVGVRVGGEERIHAVLVLDPQADLDRIEELSFVTEPALREAIEADLGLVGFALLPDWAGDMVLDVDRVGALARVDGQGRLNA